MPIWPFLQAVWFMHCGCVQKERSATPSLDEVTSRIIGSAIDVHRELGPGLLESAYEACLVYELTRRGLQVERQKPVPVVYKELRLDCGFRIDLLINEQVILELKAVEQFDPIHTAILLTYLKLTDLRLGYLINFNEVPLINGIKRIVRG